MGLRAHLGSFGILPTAPAESDVIIGRGASASEFLNTRTTTGHCEDGAVITAGGSQPPAIRLILCRADPSRHPAALERSDTTHHDERRHRSPTQIQFHSSVNFQTMSFSLTRGPEQDQPRFQVLKAVLRFGRRQGG